MPLSAQTPDALNIDAERILADLDELLASGPRKAPKILVVDDCPDYREVVRCLLEHNGYEVLEAADGVEGLRRAVADGPDLALLDFDMPLMNGYELAQELRADFDLRGIPIILFTGKANRGGLRGLPLHISDFLEKPVSNMRLLGAIRRALGGVPGLPEIQHHIVLDPRPGGSPPEAEREAGLEPFPQDSSLIECVDRMLRNAVEMGASDIHIEPQETQITVRVRLNGALNSLCTLPSALSPRLSARIKVLSSLVLTERRRPQDGQFRAEIGGRQVEFRVSILPGLHGEKIVLRVLGASQIRSSTAELGFSARDLECFEKAVQSPNGLILVTGPTGSGKTTTLYTMLGMLNKPDVNIMTVEDPVEYRLPGITQVHVKPAIGLTFDAVLRSLLRQDPDIMLVGEIRDLETAEIAMRASITGHLVLSTMHTNSAPASITRLTQMGIKPFMAAASLKMAVAQRLIRLLCPSCKVPAPLSEAERRLLSAAEQAPLGEPMRPVGCDACGGTGYSGRRPIFEVMPIRSAAMRQLILSSNDADRLTELAISEGMSSLRVSALALAAAGETSVGEALKIVLSD